jgi:hypothetical protein
MVNADIKPVVWLKRRQTKPGQLFRRGVKPSAVRTVKLDMVDEFLAHVHIVAQEAKKRRAEEARSRSQGCSLTHFSLSVS